MRLKTPREKRILYTKTTVRWILYYLLILLFFTIMTSGTYTKPMLLVPAAICVAIGNDVMAAAVTGAVCGFLTDMASFLQCWLDYKFYYEIWDYENVSRIFTHVSLKVWGLTVIASVVVYALYKLINHFLMPKEHLTIEEVIKTS